MKNERQFFTILREIGILIPIVGIMSLLTLPISIYFNEYYAIWPLLATAGASFILGGVFYLPLKEIDTTPDITESMIIAAGGWIMIAAIGSLPFLFVAISLSGDPTTPQTIIHFLDPLNSFFESVAGYTGTGLTMTIHENLLPHTLQWWRSFIQWIGGVGVIVLTLSILYRPGSGSYNLYLSEAREEKIHPSVVSTVRTIWWIILLYTVLSSLILWIAGMPPWHAINHAMTGITTGGFSVTDDSIGTYDSEIIEFALLPVMLFGAISFFAHYNILTRRFERFKKDIQSLWLITLSLIGIGFLTGANFLTMNIFTSFRDSTFQLISGITCTGFQTANIGSWGAAAQLIMVVAMIIGGAAGSTAGGIKIIRTVLVLKGINWHLTKLTASPNAFLRFKLGNSMLSQEEAENRFHSAATLTLLWLGFLFLGIILLDLTAPAQFSLSEVMFEVASAQGNVGLSTGITGPGMTQVNKLILCFNMWIGRLEIIPVLFFLRSLLGRTT